MRVALVVVAHSARLADGVVEVAAQMAPDVVLRAAGGTDDGRVGTSFAKVSAAVEALLAAGHAVVVLTDLGSATMTAAAALELLGDAAPARLADAPLVEGTVAAAVAAQIGRPLAAVVAAAEAALRGDPAGPGSAQGVAAGEPSAAGRVVRTLELVNDVGLHARPAAQLANLAARFDAAVTVDDADACSVLALLTLDLDKGATFELAAVGPQAAAAVEAIAALVGSGFASA